MADLSYLLRLGDLLAGYLDRRVITLLLAVIHRFLLHCVLYELATPVNHRKVFFELLVFRGLSSLLGIESLQNLVFFFIHFEVRGYLDKHLIAFLDPARASLVPSFVCRLVHVAELLGASSPLRLLFQVDGGVELAIFAFGEILLQQVAVLEEEALQWVP